MALLDKITSKSFSKPINRQADTAEQIVSLINRLSPLALLLAVLWLCWVLAQLLWLMLSPPTVPRLSAVSLQPRSTQATSQDAYMVFANPIQQAPINQPPPDIKVQGVMVATPSHLSSAILSINGTSQSYAIDDPLQGSGYTLTAVFWDKVTIVNASGQSVDIALRESMPLDQSSAFANNGTANVANAFVNNNANMQAMADLSTSQMDTDMQDDSNYDMAQVVDNALNQAVDELRDNPASYLSRIGVMAVGEGYQVTDAMPSDIKNRLGLESGDRVLSVNGQSVGANPMQDADLLQQVQQSGEASVQVQRGGQVITIRQQF